MYIDDSVLQTINWEGSISWMYLDTAHPPNVTAGCGLLIASVDAACALPFQSPNGGAASSDEITTDFNRVISMKGGLVASQYHCAQSVTLTEDFIESKVRAITVTNDANLAKDFTNYSAFPDSVKLALLDMEYNLGNSGLIRGYPHFDAAIRAQDWATCAAQCHRNGISAARNEWTVQQFLNIN